MSKIRYVDIPAIVQVIGCVYRNPNLIDDERYNSRRFHRRLT